jgi:cation diffusion facilitator family transporter
MADTEAMAQTARHSHMFLGNDHERAERRSWAVIALCGAMMVLEIGGGLAYGSIALVADGMHMSTHAGALLLAALAYRYARLHAGDARFTFGTGKLGDLAGFTSAIVLAMIALLIGVESVHRLISPTPIAFGEAIPIAILGLAVNVGSVWLLSGHGHHHHGHDHGAAHGADAEHRIAVATGTFVLSLFEDGVPPVFRLRFEGVDRPAGQAVTVETVRPNGLRQVFAMVEHGDGLQSADTIPEPHAFTAELHVGAAIYPCVFEEPAHHATHRDNNMRAAIVHVVADAAVSMLVIVGLLLARAFGWLWLDPVAGMVGACVIASWAYGLVRATGAILLDMNPDPSMAADISRTIECDGDRLADLHLWRLGPGHIGAILCVVTGSARSPGFYRARLARFRTLSHVTVEVVSAPG